MDLEDIFDANHTPAGTPLLGTVAAFRRNTQTAVVIFDVEHVDGGDTLLSVGEIRFSNPDGRVQAVATVRLSREECDTLITRLTR